LIFPLSQKPEDATGWKVLNNEKTIGFKQTIRQKKKTEKRDQIR